MENMTKFTVSSSKSMNFNEVYEKYYPIVYRWINIKMFDKTSVNDITADVFVKVYKHLNTFNVNLSQFETWIYNITKNTMIDYVRTTKMKIENESIDGSEEIKVKRIINLADMTNSENEEITNIFVSKLETSANIVNSELNHNITIAFESLSKKYQKIAVLFFIKEKNYNEIADILQMPLNSVKVGILRARKQLQSQLKIEYQSL
jgi:RNA polymerase sigma-70 factor, ECF subfamily